MYWLPVADLMSETLPLIKDTDMGCSGGSGYTDSNY